MPFYGRFSALAALITIFLAPTLSSASGNAHHLEGLVTKGYNVAVVSALVPSSDPTPPPILSPGPSTLGLGVVGIIPVTKVDQVTDAIYHSPAWVHATFGVPAPLDPIGDAAESSSCCGYPARAALEHVYGTTSGGFLSFVYSAGSYGGWRVIGVEYDAGTVISPGTVGQFFDDSRYPTVRPLFACYGEDAFHTYLGRNPVPALTVVWVVPYQRIMWAEYAAVTAQTRYDPVTAQVVLVKPLVSLKDVATMPLLEWGYAPWPAPEVDLYADFQTFPARDWGSECFRYSSLGSTFSNLPNLLQ